MRYTLTAQEDIGYRIGHSHPKEGFFVPKGDTIQITAEGVKLLSVRKWGSKYRGRFELTPQPTEA